MAAGRLAATKNAASSVREIDNARAIFSEASKLLICGVRGDYLRKDQPVETILRYRWKHENFSGGGRIAPYKRVWSGQLAAAQTRPRRPRGTAGLPRCHRASAHRQTGRLALAGGSLWPPPARAAIGGRWPGRAAPAAGAPGSTGENERSKRQTADAAEAEKNSHAGLSSKSGE